MWLGLQTFTVLTLFGGAERPFWSMDGHDEPDLFFGWFARFEWSFLFLRFLEFLGFRGFYTRPGLEGFAGG